MGDETTATGEQTREGRAREDAPALSRLARDMRKARGRRVSHRWRKKEERSQVPLVSMDYFYMSSKDEQDGNNPLLMVDEETGDKDARMVEKKGLGSDGEMEWLVRDMSEELKSWGHVGGDSGRLILKSDGEWS